MADKERGEVANGMESIPSEFGIPIEVENKSFQPQSTPTQIQQAVVDDNGDNLTEPIPHDFKTVEIPMSEAQIKEERKGKAENTSTWFARFLERLIAIADFKHWKVKQS